MTTINRTNIAMLSREMRNNDARLDRLEKMVSSIGAKQTLTFVPTEDIIILYDGDVLPVLVANSSARSINKIDSVKLYATGNDTLKTAITEQLSIEGLEVSNISICSKLLLTNITNITTTLSNGMTSNGFYFVADSIDNSAYWISSYVGGTPISILPASGSVWISESLANKLIADIEKAVNTNIITVKPHPETNDNGFEVTVGYTDSVLTNMLIMCHYAYEELDTIGVSIVVEYV